MPPSPSDIAEVVPPSTFWIFFWLAVAGAFGGLCGALSTRSYAEVIDEGIGAFKGWLRCLGCITLGMIEGAAAALAVSVLLAYDDKFKCLAATDWSERIKVHVLLCSIAIVSGFAGVRILRRMSANLEQKVEEAAKKADSASSEVKHLAETVEQNEQRGTDFSLGVSLATLALAKRDGDRGEDPTFKILAPLAVERLEKVKCFYYERGFVGLLLGRLYRWMQQWAKATDVLEEFLANRTANNSQDAALWYNLACYYNRRRIIESDESFRKKALNALSKAFALEPTFEDDAKNDPDKDLDGLEF